ncbi:MAG: GGDEF domain-containing protein [Actinobacteria bacterium]|nr:GGDEF domain-containing protein [Actinomycetota bacterium]
MREPTDIDLDDVFFRRLVENSFDLIVAFDDVGEIVYATPSSVPLLGITPADGIGRNIVEFIHPDDLERSLLVTAQARIDPSVIGNGVVRLRHADGSWVPLDVTMSNTTHAGRPLTVASCRFALARQSETETLLRLLGRVPTNEVLTPLVGAISWQNIGSHMAIAWTEDGSRHHVSTGLPEELCGIADGNPWDHVRRSGSAIISNDLSGLADDARQAATRLDRGGYWIEPVVVDGAEEPALVTVWTRRAEVDPKIHELGMQTACRYVELVLEFTAQRRALDHAASHDPLTGLANRAVLVAALSESSEPGTLVFCDLDRFKPVNDQFGHAIGDKLLELATQRLQACVRAEDLVARIGGDEFVVLVRDVDRARIEGLAQRIIDGFAQPFSFEGRTVSVGVSIGLAASTSLGVPALDAADAAMYEAKSAGRATFRWAPERA